MVDPGDGGAVCRRRTARGPTRQSLASRFLDRMGPPPAPCAPGKGGCTALGALERGSRFPATRRNGFQGSAWHHAPGRRTGGKNVGIGGARGLPGPLCHGGHRNLTIFTSAPIQGAERKGGGDHQDRPGDQAQAQAQARRPPPNRRTCAGPRAILRIGWVTPRSPPLSAFARHSRQLSFGELCRELRQEEHAVSSSDALCPPAPPHPPPPPPPTGSALGRGGAHGR